MAAHWSGYGRMGGYGMAEMDPEEQGVQDMVLVDDDEEEEIVAAALGEEGLEELGVVDMDLDLSGEEEAGEETEQDMVRPLEAEQESRKPVEQQTIIDELGTLDKEEEEKVVEDEDEEEAVMVEDDEEEEEYEEEVEKEEEENENQQQYEEEEEEEEAPEAAEEQLSDNAVVYNSSKTDTEDATPPVKTNEEDLLSLEKRIFFCQICQVPCLSESVLQLHYRGAKHKKKEKAMKSEMFLGMTMRNEIKTLADYIKEPCREPLIGLEYVVEHRSPGKKTPTYSCELCDYKTELAPIVQHLIGFKHRKAYIGKEFPFLLKTPPGIKEDRIQFLRRMAQDIEKDEGVKTYKIDPGPKPEPLMSVKMPIERLKSKTRWDAQDKKNSLNEEALQFLESFEIASDAEAFSVMTITEELSHTLKGYCFKQKAIAKANEINVTFANQLKVQKWAKEAKFTRQFTQAASQAIAQAAFLTLQYNSMGNCNMGPEGSGIGNQNPMIQNQQDQWAFNSEADNGTLDYMMRNQQGHNGFGNRSLIQNPMVMQNQGRGYGFEDGNLNRDLLMQTQQEDYNSRGKNWNKIQHSKSSVSQKSMMHNQRGQCTSEEGIWNRDAMMHKQVQPVQCISEDVWHPEFEVQKQIIQRSSEINRNQESMMLNRQAQQINQRSLRAPNTLPYPMPTTGSSLGLPSWDNSYNQPDFPSASTGGMPSFSPGGYFEDFDLRQAARILDSRRPFTTIDENWRQIQKLAGRRGLPNPRVYHTATASNYVSEDVPPHFSSRLKKNDTMLAKNASGMPQHIHLEPHMIADPLFDFPRDSFRKLPQDPRFSKITERHSMNLPPEIVNRVRGKDAFTATAILNQLATHHPELQRLNIPNLVKVLVDNGVIV